MKIKMWLLNIVFVVMIFTLGSMTAALMNEKTGQQNSNDVDLDMQIDKPDDQELLWINEVGTVGTITQSMNIKQELAYTVNIALPKIGQNVELGISELESQILQEEDQVKIHYIYNTNNHVVYAQFARDEKGRLEIITTQPIVVLDAGHGGFDLGEGTNDLWIEKDLNLKITLKLKELLEESGIRVVLTRSEDVYVSLYDRCELSNYVGANLFISNHLNRMNGKINGVEVIYSLKSDPLFANDLANSISTAGLAVHGVYNRRDEQFSNLDYYFVHKYNDIASYIIEYGFADHEGDAKIINERWESIIEGVAETIKEYIFD